MSERTITYLAGLLLTAAFLGLWWLAGAWMSGSITWPIDLYLDHSLSATNWWPVIAWRFNLFIAGAVVALIMSAVIDDLDSPRRNSK